MDVWTVIVGTFERLRRSLLRMFGRLVRRRRRFARLEYDSSFTFEEDVPPAHWVERVRQGAPGLLEPSLRRRAQPPAAKRRRSETVSPEAKQFPALGPSAKQFQAREPGSPQTDQVPEVDTTPPRRAEPGSPQATRRRPETVSPPARQFQALDVPEALAEAVLERPLEYLEPTPPRVARVRELDLRAGTRSERRLRTSRTRSQPAGDRAPVEPPSDAPPDAATEHSSGAPSPDDRRLGSEPHPWPELPAPLVPQEPGLDLALRAWQRERRIEREQVAL
jgi:hypothetical protein